MTDQTLQAADQTNEDDAFTTAFDNLTAPAKPDPAPAPQAQADPEPAAATPDPAPADQTEFVDPAPVAAEPVAATPDPAPAPAGDDFLQRFADLMRQAAPEPAPAPAPQVQAEPQIQMPAFSADEMTALTQYEQDFPDVSRAEQLKRRAENNVLVQHVFREFEKALKSRDDAIMTLLERTHQADLQTLVPDYSSDLRDKVVGWVGKQPSYLQAAYNNVIQNGTAEEVQDLVSRYEQANGKPAAPQAPTVTSKPAELPAATKQAVAALAPVGSKRSTVAQGVPQTYEDAFDAFAKRS